MGVPPSWFNTQSNRREYHPRRHSTHYRRPTTSGISPLAGWWSSYPVFTEHMLAIKHNMVSPISCDKPHMRLAPKHRNAGTQLHPGTLCKRAALRIQESTTRMHVGTQALTLYLYIWIETPATTTMVKPREVGGRKTPRSSPRDKLPSLKRPVTRVCTTMVLGSWFR
jgi:hypothetical protein